MKRIAIFASGSGSNAENIANYFKSSPEIEISLILSNKKDAFVLERANKLNIPSYVFNRNDFYETDNIINLLKTKKIDLVVLAGFLWLVPVSLIKAYPNAILNIHPALLPKYGGKGMYGMHVHRAVVANKESETGITIHYVNEQYDEGAIIFQKTVALDHSDTSEDVAAKIHVLEQENFPKVIEKLLKAIDEG